MKRFLPNVLTLVIFVLIALVYFGPFADLDFAWQVRTGQRILETGTLQPPEAFTYTIQGTPLPDFEWLYESILWLVYCTFGYGGLKFIRVLLVGTTLLLVGRHLNYQGVRRHGIAMSLTAAVIVLTPAWNLRPLFCTTIGLLLVTGWLHDHCTGRRNLTWWLPVLMLLWGNLHPGVIAGQGLLLAAIVWEWLNRFVKLNQPMPMPALRRLTFIGGLGLLATLVSPDPVRRLLYPFDPGLRHPIQRIFVEMQPLYTFVMKPPFTTGLAYVIAILVVITMVTRFRQYRLWEIGLIVGLGGLANLASRSLQDWLLIMLLLGVPHIVVLLAQIAPSYRRHQGIALLLGLDGCCKRLCHTAVFRLQPRWLATALIALFLVSAIPPVSRAMPVQDAAEWPTAAVAHIEKMGLDGNFFAPPDYGAYLIWKLPGRAKPFVDTRGFFFPPILIEDSHFIPQLGPDWLNRLKRVFEQYPTDYFLLETTGPRGALWRSLRDKVGLPLYVDEKSVLLTAQQVRDGCRILFASVRP